MVNALRNAALPTANSFNGRPRATTKVPVRITTPKHKPPETQRPIPTETRFQDIFKGIAEARTMSNKRQNRNSTPKPIRKPERNQVKKSKRQKSTAEIRKLRQQNELLIELLQGAFGQSIPKLKNTRTGKVPKAETKPSTFSSPFNRIPEQPLLRATGSSHRATYVSPPDHFPSPPVIYPLTSENGFSPGKPKENFVILQPQQLPKPKKKSSNRSSTVNGRPFFADLFKT